MGVPDTMGMSVAELLWVEQDDPLWTGAQALFSDFVAEAAEEVPAYREHSGGLVGQGHVLVAVSADERATGALEVTEPWNCPYPLLAWVYVDPDHRRAGVGRALVDAIVERFGTAIAFDLDPPPTKAGRALMAAFGNLTWHGHANENLAAWKERKARRKRS